jgi:hypothetical protein
MACNFYFLGNMFQGRCPKRSKIVEKTVDTGLVFWDIGRTHGNNQTKI